MDSSVPVAARSGLLKLKNALSDLAGSVVACASSSVLPSDIQSKIEKLANANLSAPTDVSSLTKDEPPTDETVGSYGDDLQVRVARPANVPAFITVDFSVGIECGDDHLLLVYRWESGAWKLILRWQAKPFDEISGAFGDFFTFGIVNKAGDGNTKPRIVVAHGRPWCTSRFSGFDIDLLEPSSNPGSPEILWHAKRGYSRGDFEPQLKPFDEGFELRTDAICMDVDAYVRRVVYRYEIAPDGQVHRISPIGMNARGFVEEWLAAPWSEAAGFVATGGSAPELKSVHDWFNPSKSKDGEDVSHSYGPVRACEAAGVFQVEIDSALEKSQPGKPGIESIQLPGHYFQVHEIKNGYQLFSTTTKPDPTCAGPNLMPPRTMGP